MAWRDRGNAGTASRNAEAVSYGSDGNGADQHKGQQRKNQSRVSQRVSSYHQARARGLLGDRAETVAMVEA